MMIQIIYEKKACRLVCMGHAGSAPAGHDLVCASCSILIYGLAGSMMKLYDKAKRHVLPGKMKKAPVIRIESGNAEIVCEPSILLRPFVQFTYQNYINAFKLLAANYAQYVSFVQK